MFLDPDLAMRPWLLEVFRQNNERVFTISGQSVRVLDQSVLCVISVVHTIHSVVFVSLVPTPLKRLSLVKTLPRGSLFTRDAAVFAGKCSRGGCNFHDPHCDSRHIPINRNIQNGLL